MECYRTAVSYEFMGFLFRAGEVIICFLRARANPSLSDHLHIIHRADSAIYGRAHGVVLSPKLDIDAVMRHDKRKCSWKWHVLWKLIGDDAGSTEPQHK
jgi:hypothetical protein